ncbi:IDEAL domain-containing protein [Neobacillus jeddahensis]|uniref:IDEAL domain-containing protein n=1 Tax=Neobacillus jeddahensis TaxID=1461580 RepID=UPI00058DC08F|nr:IDEAL domain-containing protein [Neobacillus jeddahensis]
MKKLICKYCGNAEFTVLDVGVTLCKCGVRLTKSSDYRCQYPQKKNKQLSMDQKRQAEMISKVSLLKREIDRCLDERDEERFHKLTFELRLCQHFLTKGVNPPPLAQGEAEPERR